MESDTPRTDALVDEGGMPYDADFARKLERELAAAKAELVSKADELAAAIKQRDEARRMWCRIISLQRRGERENFFPEDIAVEYGWEYLYKEGGGA